MSAIIQSLDRLRLTSPDNAAISGGQQSLNWRQLHAAVMSLTPALETCKTLGICMKNSPAWIVADISAINAGVTNIPLAVFFSDAQLQHIIADACIDTIITDQPRRIESLATVLSRCDIDIAGVPVTQLQLASESPGQHAAAKVTYTSGSTGTPRGVRLGLSAMETVAGSLAIAAEAREQERALVLLPLSILLENIGSVYVPILAGAEIVVPDADELGIQGSSKIDVDAFVAALNRIRPNTLIVPPDLLKLLVRLAQEQQLPDSFRFIAVGGAPVGTALLEAADKAGLPVYQGYGLSECCSVVTVATPRQNRRGSVGKPLPHTSVRIDDNGEIHVSGVTFDGYLNDPDHDVDEFATGDLGYFDEDGYLFVTGRNRHRIITGYGRNISPEWIESELVAHPSIGQAAVFGDVLPALTAVVVPAKALDFDELMAAITQVNNTLPDYARIDDCILAEQPFTVANSELTAGGTPARNVIKQRYADQLSNLIVGIQ
jgi:long-chain acyl-CoA synthetase